MLMGMEAGTLDLSLTSVASAGEAPLGASGVTLGVIVFLLVAWCPLCLAVRPTLSSGLLGG